ncbi:Rossmann fold domain-containing protein [Novosphingobium sp.]|uniref:Rossmann fold domain-containing protein n=1 Tax=Novosphingobium sp. TaxID=1874826 RepID=UPI00286C1510|nr:hypothetical protein [Novosphingobium sp.]
MAVLEVCVLPIEPSAAAAAFHAEWLSKAVALLNPPRVGEDLVIAFAAADYTHTGWRLAAVQMLAREHAPARVNAVSGGGAAAQAAALAYLAGGAGITGQYLPLDDAGAGPVVMAFE